MAMSTGQKAAISSVILLLILASVLGGLYFYKTEGCYEVKTGVYSPGEKNVYGTLFIPKDAKQYTDDKCTKPYV